MSDNCDLYWPTSFDRYDFKNITNEEFIDIIERCGIDAVSIRGSTIMDYIYWMTFDQISIVTRYKPNLYRGEYLFCPTIFDGERGDISMHILENILENDDNYEYNTVPIYWYSQRLEENDTLYNLFIVKDVKTSLKGYTIHPKAYMLISNHMNKGITLFDLMLKNIDLDGKKRRFH